MEFANNKIDDQEIWSKVGRNLFIFAAVVQSTQYFIQLIISWLWKDLIQQSYYTILVSAISILFVGYPLLYVLMKRVPDSKKGEPKKFGVGKFIAFIFMCYSAMYISNIIGQIILLIIGGIKGSSVINPLDTVIWEGNLVATVIYAGIAAPIFEELIFRRVLLEKVRRYGDLVAALTSGLTFGLMHMNLTQFMYATVIGTMFAYITLKTNRIRYAIILHLMINLTSLLLVQFVLSNINLQEEIVSLEGIIPILMIGLGFLLILIIGIILWIVNFKKIDLDEGEIILIDKRPIILNPWSISYILLCTIFIVFNLIG